jgi:Domain of unknown function (DUF4333)
VTVTQDDAKGNVSWQLKDAFMSVKKLNDEIGKGLSQQLNTDATVDCGTAEVIAHEVGTSFECDAKDSSGNAGKIQVTVKDNDGNVDWKLLTS